MYQINPIRVVGSFRMNMHTFALESCLVAQSHINVYSSSPITKICPGLIGAAVPQDCQYSLV